MDMTVKILRKDSGYSGKDTCFAYGQTSFNPHHHVIPRTATIKFWAQMDVAKHSPPPQKRNDSNRGWGEQWDSVGVEALALYVADPDSICGTQFGPLDNTKYDHEQRGVAPEHYQMRPSSR